MSAAHAGSAAHAALADAEHEEHHVAPVPRDPDLPEVSDTTLSFFAAGVLLVFIVGLFALLD